MKIPSFDHGGEGAPLHFLHANGYPPECYKPLFDLLETQYHLFGMAQKLKTSPTGILSLMTCCAS
jgi:hypothetical protein